MFTEDQFSTKDLELENINPGESTVLRRYFQSRVKIISNLRKLIYTSSKWTYPEVTRFLRSDPPFHANSSEVMLYSLYSIGEFRRAR